MSGWPSISLMSCCAALSIELLVFDACFFSFLYCLTFALLWLYLGLDFDLPSPTVLFSKFYASTLLARTCSFLRPLSSPIFVYCCLLRSFQVFVCSIPLLRKHFQLLLVLFLLCILPKVFSFLGWGLCRHWFLYPLVREYLSNVSLNS